jgi:aspartyl-tRNA synthetase
MLRTHHCGELRMEHVGTTVTICGWVQKVRDLGQFAFIDLRDRYGITQVNVPASRADVYASVKDLGREFVVQVTGKVIERTSKNAQLPTGDIEVMPDTIVVLNAAKTPPFKIEDETDGLDRLRMEYRYLDLRRGPLQRNLALRHRLGFETRRYLDSLGFMEIETPYLIKTTPEGARDFVVPSRLNPGQFYALPQSPQTFKQILMVSGYDRYFQIVRCFRDEDLRADRQPEFTQIDCEMAFVEQEDIITTFEGLIKHLFLTVKGLELGEIPRMTYREAMRRYGSDKPDIRYGMEIHDLSDIARHRDFPVFNGNSYVGGICATGCAEYTRKEIDALTEWVKRPQIGAKGLVYVKYAADGSLKSSVDKFYTPEDLQAWVERMGAQPGDMLFLLTGDEEATQKQLGSLRVELGNRLGLRPNDKWQPLWVIDFPLLEYSAEENRYFALHLPQARPARPAGQRPGCRARQRLRPHDERRRTRRRLHPDPRPRSPGQDVPSAGLLGRGGAEAIRLPHGRVRVWRAAARGPGLRFRPPMRHVRRGRVDPRLHRLPQKQHGPRHDDRQPEHHRREGAFGALHLGASRGQGRISPSP